MRRTAVLSKRVFQSISVSAIPIFNLGLFLDRTSLTIKHSYCAEDAISVISLVPFHYYSSFGLVAIISIVVILHSIGGDMQNTVFFL